MGLVSSSVLESVIRKALCPLCPQCVMVSFCVFFWLCLPHLRPPSPRVRPYGLASCLWKHRQTNSQTTHTPGHVVGPNVRQIYPERFYIHIFCSIINLNLFSLFFYVVYSMFHPEMLIFQSLWGSELFSSFCLVLHVGCIDLLIVIN